MANPDRYYDMPSEEAQGFIILVSELVEELIGMVAENNPVFSQYKVKMSGSTRENTRVGNPYELDFLISYEIDVEDVVEYSSGDFLGFVRVIPHRDECSKLKGFVNLEQKLVSDKLQFTFLGELIKIFDDQEYKQRDKRLGLGKIGNSTSWFNSLKLSLSNFRTLGDVGASIEVKLASPMYANVEDTIDLVLSYNLKEINSIMNQRVSYWPSCALGWTRHEKHIDKECFDNIMMHGVSVICKGPHPRILFGDTLFRLSFSYGEAQLFDFATIPQKEAYKMLKIITRDAIDKADDMYYPVTKNKLEPYPVPLNGLLKARLVSYHLKTIFFYVVYSSYSSAEHEEEKEREKEEDNQKEDKKKDNEKEDEEEICEGEKEMKKEGDKLKAKEKAKGKEERQDKKERQIDPAQKWLIWYLKKLIRCLHSRSLEHFFIEGLELFKALPLDSDINKTTKYHEEFQKISKNGQTCWPLEKYKSDCFSKFLDRDGNINACMILEDIFNKVLRDLPEDLSGLRFKCEFRWIMGRIPGSS